MAESEAVTVPAAQTINGNTRRMFFRTVIVIAIVLAIGSVVPLLTWQGIQSARALCQTNQRRLAVALLQYAQDYEGRLPPTEYRGPGKQWQTWIDAIAPYVAIEEVIECPANPVKGAHDPFRSYAYSCSYALNERFFGRFSPGPFPIEDLEIPAQTALIVEGGPFRAKQSSGHPDSWWAMSGYWDTAWWPVAYPSPHEGRMNVAAADGHLVTLKVAHYTAAGHDALYGRLGGSLYNWNGGHPNGDAGGPPIE